MLFNDQHAGAHETTQKGHGGSEDHKRTGEKEGYQPQTKGNKLQKKGKLFPQFLTKPNHNTVQYNLQ
jgi:hypothetical protein